MQDPKLLRKNIVFWGQDIHDRNKWQSKLEKLRCITQQSIFASYLGQTISKKEKKHTYNIVCKVPYQWRIQDFP